MAEVTNPSTPSNTLFRQLSLVILLRWQTFRNGLRSQSEKMHVLGSVALGLFFTFLTLGGSVGLGVVAFEIAGTEKWIYLSMILWGIFMFWQFVPVLASQTNPGFDGRNLLRFPINFSAFFLMSAAYGLADPFALAGILWHIAIGIGVSIARPDLKWWAALALACSALMNLLFNRMLFAWLERLLAKRRTREIVTAIFILFFVCIQFSGVILQKWGPALKTAFENSAAVWRALPPALAGKAIEHAADRDFSEALTTTGMLLLYAIAFGGLFAFRTHAQFTGEDLGESAAPVRKKPAVPRAQASAPASVANPTLESAAMGRASGLISAPVAAMFNKELKYLYRNSMLLMNIFMPLILIVFFSMTASMPSRHGGASPFSRFNGSYAYPGAVAYLFLLIMNFCPNNLAYEGRGIERYFLAPIKFRDVMLAKNLFHGTLVGLEALLVLGVLTAMGHTPGLLVILATWAALPFAALMHFGVGNWLSLQYPRKFEFGMRRQRPSGMTMLISFGLLAAVMGTIALSGAICLWLAGLWLLPIVYLALSAAGLMAYRAMLENTSQQANAQRDSLIEQLAR
jgi:ABC-2 type transport system permease protein